MKPNIWIFAIEPLDTRYTAEWLEHVPKLLRETLGDQYHVETVLGVQKNTEVTPGAFLNFSDTNFWKSSQLCNFLNIYNQGLVTDRDHFLFTDAWNPVIIQLRYMRDLLGLKWKFHGMFHAGSYDPQDFLGREVGDTPWVRNAERSMFWCFDHNYFATEFHLEMFKNTVLGSMGSVSMAGRKGVRTGWPMEYLPKILAPYRNTQKRDLILFPHRIAPEKQVQIFLDLQRRMPQYEFVVCQNTRLTKHEYHSLLAQSKIVFSANLQETLGISCYEGALVGALPLVPDRLSYTEMYSPAFKYPSEWTASMEDYQTHVERLMLRIDYMMQNFDSFEPDLTKLVNRLSSMYFSGAGLIDNFKHRSDSDSPRVLEETVS